MTRNADPSELEKALHQALANVVDEITLNPREQLRDGSVVIVLSGQSVEEIKAAFELFTVIHGLKLQRGEYVEGVQG
jgi:orotidine-5'-phosphate decarboxylase